MSDDIPATPPTPYRVGTFDTLQSTPALSDATRQVLTARHNEEGDAQELRFFTRQEFDTLVAALRCLLPPAPSGHAEPIAAKANSEAMAVCVDTRLAENKGNGWRYDALPEDGTAYRQGLRGLDEAAQIAHSALFTELTHTQCGQILQTVRDGSAVGATWQTLNGPRFFEEMLAELVECYYSQPVVWDSIGYTGYADALGWKQVGLGGRDSADVGRGTSLPVVPTNATPAPVSTSPPRPQVPIDSSTEYDAVIIGTGAGGAPILMRLAQAGLRVLALEAGNHYDPTRDFASDERSQSEKILWSDERLSAGRDPVAFGANNSGTGVGGSTLHFTAYTPRPHPDDFRLYTDFGVGNDWPIGYDDLEPYLSYVEQFLGVSGPDTYPWGGPRSQKYALGPLPLNSAAQLMQRGCQSLGIRTSPAPNAALSQPYYREGVGWRAACTNRGFCQAGCSVGAKGSMDVTFIPVAVAHGAIVVPNAFVIIIERDSSGMITGVVYVDKDGQERRVRCRALFLCAGAVESPRLLLMNHLANENGQVGRNFLVHTGLQVWGQFGEETHPTKGIPGGLISEETHRPTNADFAGGYLLQSIGVMPVTYVSQYARGTKAFGPELGQHMDGFNHVAGINILGESLPYATNYLELSEEKDTRGLSKPRIHFTAGTNERRMEAHARTTMRAIWDAAGATDVWEFVRYAHTMGTCRMGNDPQNSVVNSDCRAWNVPNLYICDNGVYPSSLAVNPALTQMALALRVADRFIEQSRRDAV